MANTPIQIKRSLTSNVPDTLNIGEPAYSYSSNTLFIGSPAGTGSIAIGGQFYVNQQGQIFDKANAAFNAANSAVDTWVRTQANSAFNQANAAFITANAAFLQANTPSYTANSAASYANAAFAQANTDYTTISTTAGTFGNASYVPVFTVAANGRITAVTNTAISTSGATIGDVLALSIALG